MNAGNPMSDDWRTDEEIFRDAVRVDAHELAALRNTVDSKGTDFHAHDANHLGALGESLFSHLHGLPLPIEVRPHGDGGIDFEIVVDGQSITIDTKVRRNVHTLYVNEWQMKQQADITVLAHYDDASDWIDDWVGWAWKEEIASAPLRMNGSGKRCYEVPASRLHSNDELKALLARREK